MNEKQRKSMLCSIYSTIDALYRSGTIGGKFMDRFNLRLSDDYVELFVDDYKISLLDCSDGTVRVELVDQEQERIYLSSIDPFDEYDIVVLTMDILTFFLYEEVTKETNRVILR